MYVIYKFPQGRNNVNDYPVSKDQYCRELRQQNIALFSFEIRVLILSTINDSHVKLSGSCITRYHAYYEHCAINKLDYKIGWNQISWYT